jgi:sulfate transport system substrate-binding protein
MYKHAIAALITFVTVLSTSPACAAEAELLNVSYDPTREVWRALNAAFVPAFAAKTGTTLKINMSHGGSGSQARSVIDGLQADVVTIALWPDVDAIRKAGLIDAGWENELPNGASPWYSTIVFVVRKGNPKAIKDWPDLVKEGVEVVTPNPLTSGNGKLSLLAAWGAVTERGGSQEQARALVTDLYKNHAPVLDSGARGSTTTFAQKNIGDVHLTWENEAYLEIAESRGRLEIVYPPISIRAEPPIAVVDANVNRRGTRAAAEAYLQFLYSPEGQEIIAQHHYRPIDAAVQQRHAADFPNVKLFSITAVAADWNEANTKFFGTGGIYEAIYQQGGN